MHQNEYMREDLGHLLVLLEQLAVVVNIFIIKQWVVFRWLTTFFLITLSQSHPYTDISQISC
jgi:hypothetical protein